MRRLLICASGLALAQALATAAAAETPAPATPTAEPTVRLPGQAGGSAPVATPGQAAPPVKLRQELKSDFSRETRIDVLLAQAAAAREQGHKDVSQAALQRALTLAPRHPEAVYRRALYAAQDGDAATARDWFERLRPLVRPTDQRLIQVAQLVGVTLPPPPAEPQGKAQIAAPRRNVDPGGPLRAAGFQALGAGQLAAAERDFREALRLRADDRDAAGGLGTIRLRQGRFGEALPLLERASAGVDGWRWSDALQTARFYVAFDRGRAALAKGQLAAAESALKPLAASGYKDRVEAQLVLADVYYRQRRFNESAALYRDVLQRDPHRAEAVSGLAQTLLAQGDTGGAAQLAAQSPTGVSGPDRSRIEDARAKTLAQVGDTFGAGAALAQAVTSDPRNPWARYDYAQFLLAHGDPQSAAGVAAPLFAEGANDPDTLQASALYAEAAGQLDVARARLARIPPERRNEAVKALAARLDIQGTIAQARTMQQRGQGVLAITMLRNLVTQGRLSYAARSEIARTLLSLGDTYEAGALALEAANAPPPAGAHPGDAGGFLDVLAATGQDGAAANLLAQTSSLARTPEEQAAWRDMYAGYATRRADRLREAGDLAGAYDVLSQALGADPRDAGLLAALGRVYQAGGRSREAGAAYAMLLETHPQDASAWLEAARAAETGGDYEHAEALLRRAQSLKPADPEIVYEIGKVEQAQGHQRKAIAAFARADAMMRASQSGGLGRAGVLGPNPFRSAVPAEPAAPLYSTQAVAPGVLPPVAPAAAPAGWPLSPSSAAPPQVPLAALPMAALPATPSTPLMPAAFPGVPPPTGYLPAPATYAPPIDTLRGPVATGSAPLGSRIESDLAQAQREAAARLEGGLAVRARSGEDGSSRLTEISAHGTLASTTLGQGRLSATVTPVALSAGTPSGDGAQRVGANPLIAGIQVASNAKQITLPPQRARSAAGVAVALAYDSKSVHADVGSTPVGFRNTNVSAGVTFTPQVGPMTFKAGVEQRPVTDSLLSYAGDEDTTVTGQHSGPVIRQQATVGAAGEFGRLGLYADLAGKRFSGENVPSNSAFETNFGGYFRAIDNDDGERLQIGLNLNLQGYDRNLRFFTLGHGGYFSPQQFVAASVPITYSLRRDKWWLDLNIAPGMQSYREDRAPIFASDAALQGRMIALAAQNAAISAFYPSASRSGFGIAGYLRAEYQITPLTIAGGMIQFDTFGRYSESIVSLYVKQLFAQDAGYVR